MAPFYSSVCTELGRTLDAALLAKMAEENKKELARLEEVIEDAGKNFGETERRDALMAKAEYFCKIGDKVCLCVHWKGLSQCLCVCVCVFVVLCLSVWCGECVW